MTILGFMLLFLAGCQEPEDPYKDREQNLVSGEIYANDVSFTINDRNQGDIRESSINGSGVISGTGIIFSNGALKVSSHHSHTTFRETLDNVQFDAGEFQYIFDSGDMIFGYYSGCGTYCPNNVCCDLSLQISGGTGAYSGAMGGLTAAMTRDGSVSSQGLAINLSGSIWLPKKNNK